MELILERIVYEQQQVFSSQAFPVSNKVDDSQIDAEEGLSSDSDQREALSDEDDTPHPLSHPCERYLWGLMKGKRYSRANVSIAEVDGRGRSAFAAKQFNPGDFVCEYASCVRSPNDAWSEERNDEIGILSYCLDANYKGKPVTFDASMYINDPGRYINHASANYNLAIMKPVMAREYKLVAMDTKYPGKRKIENNESPEDNCQAKRMKSAPQTLDEEGWSSEESSEDENDTAADDEIVIDKRYEFEPTEYIDYLCSVAGGRKDLNIAKEMAQEPRRYLSSICSPNSWIDCILDIHQLNNYINTLQKGTEPLTAGTISEKIRRLRLCIEYVDHLHNNNEITLQCSRVVQTLKKWRQSLRKEIQKRKTEICIRSKSLVGSATSPEGFMSSTSILQDIFQMLQNCENLCPQEHKTILAYIAAHIIYKNAQRPGVVQHMEVREFEEREETEDGNFLIQVLHHKTLASSGAANIIVSPQITNLMEDYLTKIRVHIEPKSQSFEKKTIFDTQRKRITKDF